MSLRKALTAMFAFLFVLGSTGVFAAAPIVASARGNLNVQTRIVKNNDDDGKDKKEKQDKRKNHQEDGENDDDEDDDGKISGIVICHIPPGNASARHTITVGMPAARAHLAHDDTLGPCRAQDQDNQPPVITGVKSSGTTQTSTMIKWKTNEPASSKVEYAADPLAGAGTILMVADAALDTSHELMVVGLTASTTYHFRVTSVDAAGNASTAAEMTFTTRSAPPPPDTTGPVITNVHATGTTQTTTMIEWTTNERANSMVEYSRNPLANGGAIHTVASNTKVTGHSLELTGLTASTTYHFRVKSVDAAGNASASAEMTFTTSPIPPPDTTGPVITNVHATGTTQTTTKIVWNTDEPSNSNVEYANQPLATASAILSASNGAVVNNHQLMLTGLTASTTYHFRVKSVDTAGNASTSTEMTFTTLTAADASAPIIAGLTATSTSSSAATIGWTTNEPATSRVTFAKQSLSTATMVWSVFSTVLTGMHEIMLSGLSAATQYFFRVESVDASDNATTSAEMIFTTKP